MDKLTEIVGCETKEQTIRKTEKERESKTGEQQRSAAREGEKREERPIKTKTGSV